MREREGGSKGENEEEEAIFILCEFCIKVRIIDKEKMKSLGN